MRKMLLYGLRSTSVKVPDFRIVLENSEVWRFIDGQSTLVIGGFFIGPDHQQQGSGAGSLFPFILVYNR